MIVKLTEQILYFKANYLSICVEIWYLRNKYKTFWIPNFMGWQFLLFAPSSLSLISSPLLSLPPLTSSHPLSPLPPSLPPPSHPLSHSYPLSPPSLSLPSLTSSSRPLS